MKFNQFTKILALALLVTVTACKKYGYEVPDGYPDDSGNIADGTIDTNMKVIDKSMYAKARVFPGLVDQAEPRVQNAQFTLNLNFTAQTADILRISVAPKPQLSTGFYAAPGELVKIVVPAGIDGLSVQVGVHTDNLSGLSPLLRDPVIYTRKQLYAGVNFVRNLYGGYIYIQADRAYRASETSTDPFPVTFTISNACVVPDFILGESNDAAWIAKVKASLVPWLELRSKRVIYTVPRDLLVAKFTAARDPLTKPTELMQEWDKIFGEHFNAWMGLSDNAADLRDRSPQGPWRGTVDIQISGFPSAAGHSGFPFMGLYNYNDSEWFQTWVSLNQLRTNLPKPNWGTYHEFGHNCQQNTTWNWSSLGEVTNNLFSYKVAKAYGQDFRILHAPNEWNDVGLAYAATLSATQKAFDSDLNSGRENGSFSRTVPFVQLMEVYNYGIITDLYTKARHAQRLSSNDQAKKDFFFESMCSSTGLNLMPFFWQWGIQVSSVGQAQAATRYPTLSKDIWTYNIMTKAGGTNNINFDNYRTITASSSASANPVTLMFDGNATTQWQASSTASFPFTIDYNMSFSRRLTGLSLTPSSSTAGRIKDIDISYSNNGTDYTTIGSYQIPNSATVYRLNFPNPIGAKNIRIVIKNNWVNTQAAYIAELGAY